MALTIDDAFVSQNPCNAVGSTSIRLAWHKIRCVVPDLAVLNGDDFRDAGTD